MDGKQQMQAAAHLAGVNVGHDADVAVALQRHLALACGQANASAVGPTRPPAP